MSLRCTFVNLWIPALAVAANSQASEGETQKAEQGLRHSLLRLNSFFHLTSFSVNSVVLKQSIDRASLHFLKRKLIFVVVIEVE